MFASDSGIYVKCPHCGASLRRLIDTNVMGHIPTDATGHTIKAWNDRVMVVETVIRCKDCVYSEKARVNKKGFLICPASGMEITDRDYCSYGERRAKD